MTRLLTVSALLAPLAMVAACSDPAPSASGGEIVDPPFQVSGEAEGLLLVWFDAEGPHSASRRSEVPEGSRERVRVDDLSLDGDERLDPDHVYVADLREEAAGSYTVRMVSRDRFDAWVEEASSAAAAVAEGGELAVDGDADVVIYGASWCNACRSAASYLRQRNIAFVERDIEREPGAREAMLRAARGAGVNPSGIPVIDFRGQIIAGFDRGALQRAIDANPAPI